MRHHEKENRDGREYIIVGEKSKLILIEAGGFIYFSQLNSEKG